MKTNIILGFKVATETKSAGSLIDLINQYSDSFGIGFAFHLKYVVDFLKKDFHMYKPMIDHAKTIKNQSQEAVSPDVQNLVLKLNDVEIPLVKTYFCSLASYAAGGSFNAVYDSALELLRSLKLGERYKVPPGYYSKEEIFAYETV